MNKQKRHIHTNEKGTLDTLAPLVLSLDHLGQNDLTLAGGKGANLGELTGAGFPVPMGFVITTVAYDRFVAYNQLDQTIAQALHEQPNDGATIREAFEHAPIPPELEQAIQVAYQWLGQCPAAVRSSATAEDLPSASFAGQQDTFLNIVGVENLLDAVRNCWASLWTERALIYRQHQEIDQMTVKLAVVVQCLVAADVAGVLFTANPVTGARNEMVIDASPGLGEAVVSGLVTPDHYVLRKRRRGWSIAERRIGRREVVIRPHTTGGTEQTAPDPTLAEAPALSARALRQLAHIGVESEHHFGLPQDIEWAWTNGKPALLQTRPITALPTPVSHPSKQQQRIARIAAEMLPIRPYPLDVSTWSSALFESALGLFGLLGIALPTFEQVCLEEDGVVVSLKPLTFRFTSKIWLGPVRLLRQAWRYNPVHWQDDPDLRQAQVLIHTLAERDIQALSWQELLATLHEALAFPPLTSGKPRLRYYPRAVLAVGLLHLVLTLIGQKQRSGELLASVETKTLETNRALEGLAAHIRSEPILAAIFADHETTELWTALKEQPTGQAFLDALQTFLERYGHREASPLLVSQPTWKDAPEVALGILKSLALAEPRPPRRQVARDEVLKHPVLRFPPLRSAFLALLTEARYFTQIREDTHFYGTMPMPIVRRTLLTLGHRLTDYGVLDTPADIFHLKLNEFDHIEGQPSAQRVEKLRALVQRRKARRSELEGTPLLPPDLSLSAQDAGDALLSGTSGSPGIAEGPVRIIHDATEFGKLCPGEVLVAPYTNPAWTPLFQHACAVVVDSGGAGSHAAIVAREYGIPAVMGSINGTHSLVDGERVRVDGTHGLVFRVTEQPM